MVWLTLTFGIEWVAMQLLDRQCRLCHQPWVLEYPGVGRPREICFDCVPAGMKLQYPVNQRKFRPAPPSNAMKGK